MMVVGDAGLESRATKDLDIVLCCQALTDDFVEAVWSFVRNGWQIPPEFSTEHMRMSVCEGIEP